MFSCPRESATTKDIFRYFRVIRVGTVLPHHRGVVLRGIGVLRRLVSGRDQENVIINLGGIIEIIRESMTENTTESRGTVIILEITTENDARCARISAQSLRRSQVSGSKSSKIIDAWPDC